MRKSISLLLVSIFSVSILSGCGNSTQQNQKAPNSLTYTGPSAAALTDSLFVLTNTTLTPCPFVPNGNTIIFPNWEDDNKISIIPKPFNKTIITTADVKDFADYSSFSLGVINNVVYFADSSKDDCLSSFSFADKIDTKLSNNSAANIIASGNNIFYINKSNGNKLFSYDLTTNRDNIITSSKVGSYLINGDFIIYQNLDDNAKLYKCKLDGTEDSKITDFSVESFVVYSNQLLAINLTDNNRLYSINPTDLQATRIGLIDGEQLKCYQGKLYFINLADYNHLYSLTVDLTKSTSSWTSILADQVNEYYPTSEGLFVQKGVNINNPYILIK